MSAAPEQIRDRAAAGIAVLLIFGESLDRF